MPPRAPWRSSGRKPSLLNRRLASACPLDGYHNPCNRSLSRIESGVCTSKPTEPSVTVLRRLGLFAIQLVAG